MLASPREPCRLAMAEFCRNSTTTERRRGEGRSWAVPSVGTVGWAGGRAWHWGRLGTACVVGRNGQESGGRRWRVQFDPDRKRHRGEISAVMRDDVVQPATSELLIYPAGDRSVRRQGG